MSKNVMPGYSFPACSDDAWRKPLLICRMEIHLRLTSGLYRSICESGVDITVSRSCWWGETVNHYEG